jgi:hypothetical protein
MADALMRAKEEGLFDGQQLTYQDITKVSMNEDELSNLALKARAEGERLLFAGEKASNMRDAIRSLSEARAAEFGGYQESINRFASEFGDRIAPGTSGLGDVGNLETREAKTTLSDLFGKTKEWFENGPLKGKGKGIAIAAGLLGAGYVISNLTSNDPMPMDQPQHNQAPNSDGTYSQQGAGTGGMTVGVADNNSGYAQNGMRIKVSATSLDNSLTPPGLSSLVQEGLSSAFPIDVRMNVNTTDNTNRLDNSWYQQRIADAMR